LGDRCGTVVDSDGYTWMVGTHKAEPSAKEMKKGIEEKMKQQPGSQFGWLIQRHPHGAG
jgi:hypothetical protein